MQSVLLGALSLAFGKQKLKLMTIAYKMLQDLALVNPSSFSFQPSLCSATMSAFLPFSTPSYLHPQGLCYCFFRNALCRFCSRLAVPRVRCLFICHSRAVSSATPANAASPTPNPAVFCGITSSIALVTTCNYFVYLFTWSYFICFLVSVY